VVEELHTGRIALFLQLLHQLACLVVRLFLALSPKFDKKPSSPLRQKIYILRVEPFLPHISDKNVIESLKPRRFMGQDFWNVVSGAVDIGVSKDEERTHWRAIYQVCCCFENRNASTLRTHKGTSNMEPAFWQ